MSIFSKRGTLRAAGVVFASALSTFGADMARAEDQVAADQPAKAGELEEIVVTDTIPVSAERPANIRVLPCAELLTDSIRRIFVDDSVSEVFGGENQLF